MGVSREEKLKMLSEKRLSVGNISSPMIYEFFETENEESLIRGISVDAEIIYRRKQYKVKANISSKYRMISWNDGTESVYVEYKKKKFAPRTNLKENWIQLNNDVTLKINSVLEYNILLILLVDADKRFDSFDTFVGRELPEKFIIEENTFSNYYFTEVLDFDLIEMKKYNAMMDVVWRYEGNIRFSSIYKHNAFSFIMDKGEMYDFVSGEKSTVDEQHKAYHRFEKGSNMLLAYSKTDNTLFMFTNSLQSDSYALKFTDEKDALKLGAWLLDRMKNMWNKDVSMYFSFGRNQNTKSSGKAESGYQARYYDNLEEEVKKYVSKLYDLVCDYPSSIIDTRTFSAYLSDVFPADKKIMLVLSVLHNDGIIERLKKSNVDEAFIKANTYDIVTNYGIQEDVALLGVKLWCEIKPLL